MIVLYGINAMLFSLDYVCGNYISDMPLLFNTLSVINSGRGECVASSHITCQDIKTEEASHKSVSGVLATPNPPPPLPLPKERRPGLSGRRRTSSCPRRRPDRSPSCSWTWGCTGRAPRRRFRPPSPACPSARPPLCGPPARASCPSPTASTACPPTTG